MKLDGDAWEVAKHVLNQIIGFFIFPTNAVFQFLKNNINFNKQVRNIKFTRHHHIPSININNSEEINLPGTETQFLEFLLDFHLDLLDTLYLFR